MAKRRTHDSDDYYSDSSDNPIGLTSAFEVIRDPQAVQYDKGDQAIGLTEAFASVDADEPRAWDEAGKWDGFDWGAGYEAEGSSVEHAEPESDAGQESTAPEEQQPAQVEGATASNVAYGVSVTTPFNEEARQFDVAKDLAHASASSAPSKASTRGKHAAHAPKSSERMQKSRRTRKTLIAIVVLLILALCALGYFIYHTLTEGQVEADHQAQEKIEAPKETDTQTEGDDAVQTTAQLANVPNLTTLMGKTTDEAVAELGRGAFVSNNQKVKEKGSAIKTNVTIALNDEPNDSKTGVPSVYLGLDKDGKIIQVGYSAAASALGFGSLSFADAVNSEHVIERTLAKIGASIEDGSAVLPDDSSKYVTYGSDKTTVVKERCSFDGDVDVDGTPCAWSAVLSYDYTTQVITGNLSDTVRVIYVYVTKK